LIFGQHFKIMSSKNFEVKGGGRGGSWDLQEV